MTKKQSNPPPSGKRPPPPPPPPPVRKIREDVGWYGKGQCRDCHSFAINIDPQQILCDVCFYKIPLFELLAVLHRDGGQYLVQHGVRKASIDAEKVVGHLHSQLDRVEMEGK